MAPQANSRRYCESGQAMMALRVVIAIAPRRLRLRRCWQRRLADANEQGRGPVRKNEVDDREAAKGDELIRHRRARLAGAHHVVNDPGLTPDLGDGPAALDGYE